MTRYLIDAGLIAAIIALCYATRKGWI